MRAVVYPGADGWRWRIQGTNNETLASGEAYVRRRDAEDVIKELFGTAGPVEVIVRDHGDKVTGHYTLRSTGVEGDQPALFDKDGGQ